MCYQIIVNFSVIQAVQELNLYCSNIFGTKFNYYAVSIKILVGTALVSRGLSESHLHGRVLSPETGQRTRKKVGHLSVADP